MSDHYMTASSCDASRKVNKESVESSSLIRPRKPQQGKVIAAGKGKVRDDGKVAPMGVSIGDVILFGKYGGQEIKLDGEELLIMREDEVLGVIEGKPSKKKKK